VHLVSDWRTDLTDRIEEFDTHHPLVDGELDLASEIVHMLDQAAQDDSIAVCASGTDGVQDVLGEVGVESGWLSHVVRKMYRQVASESWKVGWELLRGR
jgi:hypothetical protein